MQQVTNIDQFNLSYEDIVAKLAMMMTPNNQAIKEAGKFFKSYVKGIFSIQTLFKVLLEHQQPEIRNLAAVVLKKSIIHNYRKIEQEGDKTFIKRTVLEKFFDEPAVNVRNAIGHCVGVLTKLVFDAEGSWNDLLLVIDKKTAKECDMQSRVLGTTLLRLTLDTSCNFLKDHLKKLAQFLNENLQVDNLELQIETIKALSIIIENSAEDDALAATFSELLPIVITAVDVLISKKHFEEAVVYQVLETICTQIEVENRSIDKYIPDIVRYFIGPKFCMNPELPISYKESALDILAIISEYRRPIFTKNMDLLVEVMSLIFNLALDKSKIEERDSQETMQDVALMTVEDLSKNLPKKKFFPLMKAKLTELSTSADPKHHELMFLLYASIAEGNCDSLKSQLNHLIKEVFPHGFNNANDDVRTASMKACFHFSEFLQPEIVDYHADILPPLINNLEKPMKSEDLEQCVFAIDIFVEKMEEADIKNYLENLVGKLVTIIGLPEDKCSYALRNQSIDCLGSVIASAESLINPYLDPIFNCLNNCFHSAQPTLVELKGTCLGCLGRLARSACDANPALYKEKFSPLLQHIVTTQYEAADYTFIEGVFTFLYNSAGVLKEEFAEVFPQILDQVFNMANSTNSATTLNQDGEIDLESDVEDEEGDCAYGNMTLPFIHAKSAGIRAIGEFCENCPLSFQPHFAKVEDLVDENYQHAHESIRHQSCLTLINLAIAKVKAHLGGKLAETGAKGWASAQELPEDLQKFLEIDLLSKYQIVINQEESKDNVAALLEILKIPIETLGATLLANNRIKLLTVLLEAVLGYEINCYSKGDDDEEDQENDAKIFSDCLALLVAVSEVLGADGDDFICGLCPILETAMKKGDIYEYEEVFGHFCDIFESSPSIIGKLGEKMSELIYESRELRDEAVSRNGAFCIGLMFDLNPEVMLPHLPKALGHLQTLQAEANLDVLKDNIISAVAKIYAADPSKTVPAAELMKKILERCPFKGDTEESGPVSVVLTKMTAKDPEVIQSNLEAVLKIMLDTVLNADRYKLKPVNAKILREYLTQVAADASAGAVLKGLVNTLSPENQNNLSVFLTTV